MMQTSDPILVVFIGVLVIISVLLFLCIMDKRAGPGWGTRRTIINYISHHERIKIAEVAKHLERSEEDVIETVRGVKRKLGEAIRIEDDEIIVTGSLLPKELQPTTVVYMVICPHCSHKNIQGRTECENCGASL